MKMKRLPQIACSSLGSVAICKDISGANLTVPWIDLGHILLAEYSLIRSIRDCKFPTL